MIPKLTRTSVTKKVGTAADAGGPDVVFVQCAPPAIDSGVYQIQATQTISASTDGPATSYQDFFIAGPRVQLPPGTVNSVFPAGGTQGEFSTVLPHVVFNNVTLPWQRNMGSAPDPPSPVPTWLAVMLFDESDPPPPLVSGTKQDLISPPSGTFYPEYSLEPGELATDPVVYCDVPFTLFNAISPSLNDLGWLAHVRQVDAAAQAVTQHFPAASEQGAADYSVVFGNRLPAAGSECKVVLVSLENYATYLPSDTGTASGAFQSPLPTAIRLPVLFSWSFETLQQTAYFEDIVAALSVTPGGVQFPVPTAHTQNQQADAFVAAAFSNGYTAVLENLPDGTPTASWYRGPLLPETSATQYLTPPYPGPDGLRRFDPDTGLYDISYAAAWQLGQLLALQSGTFSSALYRWNLSEMSAEAGAQQQHTFHAVLDSSISANGVDIPGVIRGVVRPAVNAIREKAKKGGS